MTYAPNEGSDLVLVSAQADHSSVCTLWVTKDARQQKLQSEWADTDTVLSTSHFVVFVMS